MNIFMQPLEIVEIIIKVFLSVVIGGFIGNERAKHGRAAGMRTHILVCLGAAMTAMTSLYVYNTLGVNGDVFRISAQVVSGVGFLGAGMIILRSGNMITGLTTAAGVWATATIGIGIGYGFYWGALIVFVFFLISIVLFAKLEKTKKKTEVIYFEIDDMYRANYVIDEAKNMISTEFSYQFIPPKSGNNNHLGANIVFEKHSDFEINTLLNIENVIYVSEE